MNSEWKRRCLNSFDEIRFISEIEKKRYKKAEQK